MTLLLSEQLAYTTVRIKTKLRNGGDGFGTGFFFQFCYDGTRYIPCIVTNKHVLDDALEAQIQFSLKDANGDRALKSLHVVRISEPSRARLDHPDPEVDLTVIPFGELLLKIQADGVDPFFRAFGVSDIPSDADMRELGAIEPIVMVGYPIGLWDHVNNQPITRRGVTATHPNNEFQGRAEFVIDCACWPGSSGSPVVLYNEAIVQKRDGSMQMTGPQFKFLGVLYAGPQYTAEGEIIVSSIPTSAVPMASTKVMINLGYVIKAARLREIEVILKSRVSI